MLRTVHLVATLHLAVPAGAYAQGRLPIADDIFTEEPELEVIQNRKYELAHEITLLGGGLPADPYYKGVTGTVGYTVHFSHHVAWEVGSFTYSYNLDSKLKKEVLRIAGNIGARQPVFPEIDWFAASRLVIKPLYGKEAIFNTDVVHLEGYLQLGPAVVHTRNFMGSKGKLKDRYDFGGDIGAGLRLWLGESVSLRIDIGELVYFIQGSRQKKGEVKQALHLHLGFGFNLRGEQ